MTTPRDKAIQTIAKLRRVAEHPNTGKPEADAARARIEALRVKHQITASPPPRAKVPYSDSTDWNKAAEAAKKAADAARIMADAIRHADAAKKYREKMQNRDSMGRPFPKSGDIFDEAIRNSGDTRTAAERNKDVQNSFRKASGFCNAADKEKFYDRGGEPRKRNKYAMPCERCGGTLQPGDGAIMQVGLQWKAWCCERTPSPRKKRF